MRNATVEFLPILHVASPTFDPHAFLAAHPEIKPYMVWHVGEPRPGGRTEETSGFKLDLGSGQKGSTVVPRCVASIRAITPALRKARRAGAKLFLDIGVMPDARVFYVNTRFTPDDLAALSKAGVELCVSSYPPHIPEPPRRRSPPRRPPSKKLRRPGA